jgi:ABC-2 type transport system ATP-binding protein
MKNTPIKVTGLSKTFNAKSKYPVKALRDIDFEIEQGTVCGLIGSNGAGKTTLIKIILGFLNQSKGQVSIYGNSPDLISTKSKVGFQADNQFRSKKIRVREYLEFHSQLAGIKNNKDQIVYYLETFHMTGTVRRKLSDLSKGMRQKIELIAAFLGNPQLVILDEPTAGLDPPSVFELRDFIIAKKKEGITILFSSHNLTEVEKSCDRVLSINNGAITGDFLMKDTEPGFLENVFKDRSMGEGANE